MQTSVTCNLEDQDKVTTNLVIIYPFL